MADKFDSDLDKIFDGYDKAERGRQANTLQQKAEEDTFEKDFAAVRQNVIRPVFQETLDRLKLRGHDGQISERAYSVDSQGRPTEASIELVIYAGGRGPDRHRGSEYPHLAYVGDRRNRSAYAHVSTIGPGRGGSAGAKGKYQLKEITADVVKTELLALLKVVLV